MSELNIRRTIPPAVVAVVAEELGNFFTHAKLDNLFRIAGALGEPPAGNKIDKCSSWLGLTNQLSTCERPLEVLGEVLGEYMEAEILRADDPRHRGRERILKVLEKNHLSYLKGGKVGPAGRTAGPTRSLEAILRARDLASVEKEFERALTSVESDPAAAVTAACAVIESFCRIHIEDHRLELPAKQDLGGLWKVVRSDLRLDGGQVADDDIKKILQGLASIADGFTLKTRLASQVRKVDTGKPGGAYEVSLAGEMTNRADANSEPRVWSAAAILHRGAAERERRGRGDTDQKWFLERGEDAVRALRDLVAAADEHLFVCDPCLRCPRARPYFALAPDGSP